MPDRLPNSVMRAFGLSGSPVVLRGGQGQAIRIGDVVVKPCDDVREMQGLLPVLDTLREDGFRIAPPVSARDGRWVVDGWVASRLIAGTAGLVGREAEAVDACRALHAALRDAYPHADPPDWLTHRADVWQQAMALAWGETDAGDLLRGEAAREVTALQQRLRPVDDLPPQITHGDPCGDNVLFADGLPPAIIDMPPYWRAAGYAIAVILADAVAWEGSSPDVLDFGRNEPHFAQLLLRACLFRIAVAAMRCEPGSLRKRLRRYGPALAWSAGG